MYGEKMKKPKNTTNKSNSLIIQKYLIISIMSSYGMSLGNMGIADNLIVLTHTEEAIVQTKHGGKKKLALS